MRTEVLKYSVLSLAILIVLPNIPAQKGAVGADHAEVKLPVELVFSPDHFTVAPHSNLKLPIKWVNHSDRQIWCGDLPTSTGISEKYIYDIRSGEGKPVPRIPGKEKEHATNYPYDEGDFCRLAPGASLGQFVVGLMSAFEMNQPGEYTIRVSLPDPDHPGQILGRSNVVTVTVKVPQ